VNIELNNKHEIIIKDLEELMLAIIIIVYRNKKEGQWTEMIGEFVYIYSRISSQEVSISLKEETQ